MILAIFLTAIGFVFSIHFATVKTVFGLFWRDGYVPPPDLLAAAERVERRWENPAFFAAVSLGRTLGTFLLTLGLWLWTHVRPSFCRAVTSHLAFLANCL